jgi:membrane-associated phospholipid phosphatase
VVPLPLRQDSIFRRSECVLLAYFVYTAFLSIYFRLSAARCAVAFAIPAILAFLVYAHSSRPRPSTKVLRDCLPIPLILAGYWQVDWFRPPAFLRDLESSWLAWDHLILHGWKLHSAIESLGALIPSVLEIAYVFVYAVPILCIGALYLCGRRDRVDDFLFPFALGTLFAYALLPHFPSASPRLEFPMQDLPGITTILRRFNMWILNHGDIRTSVFPSGHVAAAFSAAFGMRQAVPERKWMWRALLIEAVLVALATVYGRYHYAADCMASLILSLVALAITLAWNRRRSVEPSERSWRAAVGIIVIACFSIRSANAQVPPDQKANIVFQVRLQSDISTYSSHPGDPIRAVVLAGVRDANQVVIPTGSLLLGGVRKITTIGHGLIHERASLEIEFNEWMHPNGTHHPLKARLVAIDNAREQVTPTGRIRGILAAGGAPSFLLGMWSRPDSLLFARTAVGFAGLTHFVCQRVGVSPIAVAGIVALRFVAVPWPDAEIHLPPGTELLVSVKELTTPSLAEREPEVSPEPPSESLTALATGLPVQTTRGSSMRSADITNMMFLGTQDQLHQAFFAAGWWPAEPLTHKSAIRVYKAISAQRGYPTAPISTLLLDSKIADVNFQKAFNSVSKRHHIRIWKQEAEYEGRQVWVGAATHDIAMRFREAGNTFTHRIDPKIDRERGKIIDDLTFAGCTEKIQFVDRPNVARVAGDDIVTDGQMAMVSLKDCESHLDQWLGEPHTDRRTASSRFLTRLVLEARQAIIRGNVYYWGYRGARYLLTAHRSVGETFSLQSDFQSVASPVKTPPLSPNLSADQLHPRSDLP